MNTTAVPGSFSLASQCVRCRGLLRLLGILVGWKAESSQEVATHTMMVIGFMIEGYVLSQVVLARFRLDFPDADRLSALLSWIVAGIIVLLLFHQFVIFHNFSVPKDSFARSQKQVALATLKNAIVGLQQGHPVGETLKALKEIEKLTEPEVVDEQWRRRVRKFLEISIYGLFGVLTGEAGYMLTVLHEHNPAHWSSQIIWTVFQTRGLAWGKTLECAFLFCAMAICFFVLVWDLFISLSPVARKEYDAFLSTFWWNDAASFCFWLCLFAVVTPSARWALGARIVPFSLGLCESAWFFLGVCSSLYVYKIGGRFLDGLKTLGEADTYGESRVERL